MTSSFSWPPVEDEETMDTSDEEEEDVEESDEEEDEGAIEAPVKAQSPVKSAKRLAKLEVKRKVDCFALAFLYFNNQPCEGGLKPIIGLTGFSGCLQPKTREILKLTHEGKLSSDDASEDEEGTSYSSPILFGYSALLQEQAINPVPAGAALQSTSFKKTG